MECEYVKNYEYVAIFDADFQPKPDFLKLTMPHFKVSSKSGLRSGLQVCYCGERQEWWWSHEHGL